MKNIVFDVPLAANTQTEGTYVPRVSKQMANKQNRNILWMCQNLFLKFVLHPVADKMAS